MGDRLRSPGFGFSRRIFLLSAGSGGAIALAGCSSVPNRTKEPPTIAVTIDDFNIVDGPLLSADERHQAILDALDHHRHRACGFPAGKFIDNPEGKRRLEQWVSRGHALGCHSYSHSYYSGRDPAAFGADLDRALPLAGGYPTSLPLFRFPFLAEGRTIEGRDAARTLLHQHGVANAHVTIDTSDWYISNRLTERLTQNPGTNVAPYRDYYVRHLLDRASYYDQLAHDVLGRSIPHTLLIHHNLATALFLRDVLNAFRSAGCGDSSTRPMPSPTRSTSGNRTSSRPGKACPGSSRRKAAVSRTGCAIPRKMATMRSRRWTRPVSDLARPELVFVAALPGEDTALRRVKFAPFVKLAE